MTGIEQAHYDLSYKSIIIRFYGFIYRLNQIIQGGLNPGMVFMH